MVREHLQNTRRSARPSSELPRNSAVFRRRFTLECGSMMQVFAAVMARAALKLNASSRSYFLRRHFPPVFARVDLRRARRRGPQPVWHHFCRKPIKQVHWLHCMTKARRSHQQPSMSRAKFNATPRHHPLNGSRSPDTRQDTPDSRQRPIHPHAAQITSQCEPLIAKPSRFTQATTSSPVNQIALLCSLVGRL